MPEMFKEYKVYGPYLSNSEQRRIVTLVSDEHRTTMSYARYLMCKKLGEFIEDGLEVDHINNNKLDDRIDNLQVLPKRDHQDKSKRGKTFLELECPQCGDTFFKERRQIVHKERRYLPCCSRSCAGKYQRSQELA